MKSQDLLSQLTRLENELSNFSFEELNTAEAQRLKQSFTLFKQSLESRVNNQTTAIPEEKHLRVEGYEDALKNELSDKKLKATEGSLIAHVSHEVRTPLNGIIGFTDLLKESGLRPDQKELVDAIQTASHSLLDIINELLEFSKLSLGKEHFETIDFNFQSIIKDVVYLCNTLILSKNVVLKTEIDARIPNTLLGDPSKLSQILLNLLGNAVKFVEAGSILLSVKLKEERNNLCWLEFKVTDTGIGIAENNLKHIFESFKQAEPNTYIKYGGSGLGLSIVKQIIENLNGDIKVSSELGKGTTFKFIIPYKKGNPNYLLKDKSNRSVQYSERELVRDMRILVFEDNILNQRLIDQRLKSWGCVAYITDNPLYGINILKNNRIDLVLMDLRMPGMDGYQVTQRIRNLKDETLRQVPIIALTADFSVSDKEKCDVYGISDFVLKPYSPDELLSKLILNRKKTTPTKIAAQAVTETNNHHSTVIDLQKIYAECMGEMDLLEELIQLFRQNIHEFIGKAKFHIKNKDYEGLVFVAHKMKPGLAMIQASNLHAYVLQIHEKAKEEADIKQIEDLYNSFLEAYPSTEQSILKALNKLKNGS